MKRVLQSCFDPLPRFMSMKSLAAVVTLLLVGTAISVFEYLESARMPVRRPGPASPSFHETACQASDVRGDIRYESEISLPAPCPRSKCESATSSAEGPTFAAPRRTAEAEPHASTAPPSVFEPAPESNGPIGG